MPIAHNAEGNASYVPFNTFYREHPMDFFAENPSEYRVRLKEARVRVLEAIRYSSQPLQGRGLNHEVKAIGSCIEDLADFVDLHDRKRAEKVRKQRQQDTNGLALGEYRLRSPQQVQRRRRALFRHSDIPEGYFERISKRELDRFVDLMRWYLIEAAIIEMHDRHEIALINNGWYVKVSAMDDHRAVKRSQTPRRQIKWDDRSFHGRPCRDRKRHLRIV